MPYKLPTLFQRANFNWLLKYRIVFFIVAAAVSAVGLTQLASENGENTDLISIGGTKSLFIREKVFSALSSHKIHAESFGNSILVSRRDFTRAKTIFRRVADSYASPISLYHEKNAALYRRALESNNIDYEVFVVEGSSEQQFYVGMHDRQTATNLLQELSYPYKLGN